MSDRVDLQDFLRRLQSVRFGLADRENMVDQGTCLVFMNAQVMTYNDELACRTSSLLSQGVCGAVKADKLIEHLEKWPDDVIEIEQEDNQLVVRGGKRRLLECDMERDVQLPVDQIELPDKWQPLPLDFDEAAQMVSRCTSKNEKMLMRTLVRVSSEFMEACDNAQLVRYKIPMNVSEDFLVKGDALKAVCSLGVVEFCETEYWLHLRSSNDIVLSCRRYHDENPKDFGEIFGFDGEAVSLPKGLSEAVARAAVSSSENPDTKKVIVQLRKNRVKIKGVGVTTRFQELSGVKYDGPAIDFMIAPNIFSDILDKYSECEIISGKLKVTGNKFVYVAGLSPTAEQINGES